MKRVSSKRISVKRKGKRLQNRVSKKIKIAKNQTKKTTPATKNDFTCPACGYEAYKMARYSHCPLCIICKGCARKIRHCRCREGE